MVIDVLKQILIILLVIIGLLVILGIVTYRPLPDNSNRHPSTIKPIASNSKLGKQLLPVLEQHPDRSGVYILDDSHEAFLARLALAKAAEHSLDVQYYIWHDDTTGHLLLQSLYEAAERGVRVRLLLDDNNTSDMDELLTSVNAHPNIEVRLFNPFMQRQFRLLGYLSDFTRLNRRMHNKTFTADGLLTIGGGRNVGDEYFGFGTGVMFADLDLLAVGPVAQDVGEDFDRYWASELSYPIERIAGDVQPSDFDTTPVDDKETKTFLADLERSTFVQQLKAGSIPLIWTSTKLISDPPQKVQKKPAESESLLTEIVPLMTQTQDELLIISPYFVPTKKGKDFFSKLANEGKQVAVLTNSLAATDVVPVHAGYVKYRKPLLKSGVSFFELKPQATVITKRNHRGMIERGGSSLHAKTFIVDNQTLFIGSFNTDPRSARLNTEMGFVFDSPEVASYLAGNMKKNQMAYSYDVSLTPQGNLQWETEEDQQIITYDTEPESSIWARIGVWICALLPIEWLL